MYTIRFLPTNDLNESTHALSYCSNPLRIMLSSCPNTTFYFFFQAEDGIRDPLVTGVQTCALPISCQPASSQLGRAGKRAPFWLLAREFWLLHAQAFLRLCCFAGGRSRPRRTPDLAAPDSGRSGRVDRKSVV